MCVRARVGVWVCARARVRVLTKCFGVCEHWARDCVSGSTCVYTNCLWWHAELPVVPVAFKRPGRGQIRASMRARVGGMKCLRDNGPRWERAAPKVRTHPAMMGVDCSDRVPGVLSPEIEGGGSLMW
jgi:hypothetical protein